MFNLIKNLDYTVVTKTLRQEDSLCFLFAFLCLGALVAKFY